MFPISLVQLVNTWMCTMHLNGSYLDQLTWIIIQFHSTLPFCDLGTDQMLQNASLHLYQHSKIQGCILNIFMFNKNLNMTIIFLSNLLTKEMLVTWLIDIYFSKANSRASDISFQKMTRQLIIRPLTLTWYIYRICLPLSLQPPCLPTRPIYSYLLPKLIN